MTDITPAEWESRGAHTGLLAKIARTQASHPKRTVFGGLLTFIVISFLAFNGTLSVSYNGQRIPIEDAASIPANLRGYAQGALDAGLLNARYTLTQGPLDPLPTIHAWFDPNTAVTRAAYAVFAGRYAGIY